VTQLSAGRATGADRSPRKAKHAKPRPIGGDARSTATHDPKEFNMTRIAQLATASAVALIAGTLGASAASLVSLSGDNTLQMFDTTQRKVTATMMVKGLTAPLAGFDIRPADGMLYGLQRDGQIVTIDMKTGQANPKARLDQMLPNGVTLTVDFNPVADRLRVVGTDGTNLRINVDDGKTIVDGKLKFADADAAKGATPMIANGAYSNKFKGAKETALYEIDAATGGFLRQAPPNDGVLNTLGNIGMKPARAAFNIESDGKGGNTGWLLVGDVLSRVDIATGRASMVGKVSGLKDGVSDIAVLPAM
jgi:hypothetical protein